MHSSWMVLTYGVYMCDVRGAFKSEGLLMYLPLT